ncbi:MAG: hypothetical protein O6924_13020 [Alphaproteobacteria bacterium]|nr:hypothetical protein [Alphaproteobacteria bacterium]
MPRPNERRRWVDFGAVNQAAYWRLPDLLNLWLPKGKLVGNEYIALNPTRRDRNLGSFKINIQTGRWADFATGDKGGDVVSLFAYLTDLSQVAAARRLAELLEMPVEFYQG